MHVYYIDLWLDSSRNKSAYCYTWGIDRFFHLRYCSTTPLALYILYVHVLMCTRQHSVYIQGKLLMHIKINDRHHRHIHCSVGMLMKNRMNANMLTMHLFKYCIISRWSPSKYNVNVSHTRMVIWKYILLYHSCAFGRHGTYTNTCKQHLATQCVVLNVSLEHYFWRISRKKLSGKIKLTYVE